MRATALAALCAALAAGACGGGCSGGAPAVPGGRPSLTRPELRPTAPEAPREAAPYAHLVPPREVAPWRVEASRTEHLFGMVALRKKAYEAEERRDIESAPAIKLEGELGERKRLVIPGAFDPQRFNQVVVRINHYGKEPEPTRVVLRKDGAEVLQSPWLAVPAKAPPPETVVFDFPEARRAPGTIDEIAVETRGSVTLSAVLSVDLLHVPEHAMLPAPDAPDLVTIGGEERRGVGLSSTLPLEARLDVPAGAELAFSYGALDGLRIPGQDLTLVVTVAPEGAAEGAEPTVRRRFGLESSFRDAPRWHAARIDLGAFAGAPATARFELEAGAGPTAFCALAELSVSRRGSEAPTVLLVTSDTHRADHMGGAREGAPVRTPRLDALAARGVYFTDAFASTNVTNPSHVAVMTGLPPRDTRVLNNSMPLVGDATTLAERFREAGFRTLAAVSAFHLLHEESGLGQGFDRVNGPAPPGERDGEATLEVLRGWLDEAAGEPLFVWLHLFDAHAPYGPPRPFGGRYWQGGDPFDAERTADLPPIKQIPPFLAKLKDRDFPYQQYRAEVDYVDHVMGLAFEIPRLRAGIVAFTADHGESFGEHGIWWDHADLFPETIHVPLILAWPGGPRGRRVTEPVEQIDVAHTLLELAGVPSGDFPGRALTWALERPEQTQPRFQLAAHGNVASVQSGPWHLTLHLRAHHEWALEAPREKHRVELYHLRDDPGCLRDLVRDPEHFETARTLRRRLIEWLQAAPAQGLASRGRIQSQAALQGLEELGYTGAEEGEASALYAEDAADEWCRYFAE